MIDFADCVVAGAVLAGVFFGGAGSATAAGAADFSCVFAGAVAAAVEEVFTFSVECTEFALAAVAVASVGAAADFEATSATGFVAGDGCVAVTGAELAVKTFAEAAVVLEAMGVAAGGGGIGATVCPGALATARVAKLAAGFSESSGSAGKSGNTESGT